MATKGIFVSSASPDAPIVRLMIGRLRNLGLESAPSVELPRLWHYEEEMMAGDPIFATVSDAIDASQVAVLCLSDEALRRPWIAGEVALIRKALLDKQIEHVIRVKVGPLVDKSLNLVRDFVRSTDDLEADVSGGAETELQKLAGAIHAKLGLNAPKILAIAVVAMDKTQAGELVATWQALDKEGKPTPVSRVCDIVGVRPPALFELILSRYGDRPEEMLPFRNDTLRDILHAELNQANLRRVINQYVPLFPRWIHGELLGEDADVVAVAQQTWEENDSLLIIDSISVFHKDVRQQLLRVPDIKGPRAAVMCLPPYTRQTVTLEEALRAAFRQDVNLGRLSSWFEAWVDRWKNPDRVLAFDTSTSVSLGSWLDRRFTIVGGKYAPQAAARNAMPESTYKAAGAPKQ